MDEADGTAPPPPTLEAVNAVRGAVRAALAVENGLDPAWAWPGVEVEDFLRGVRRHRVTEVIATHGDALDLPAEVTAVLTTDRGGTRMAGMMLSRELVRLTAVLGDIPFLVFKGQALAVQTTGDPFGRGHGDLDVLVAPESAAAAADAIEANGWSAADDYARDPATWAWRHQLSTSWEMTFLAQNSSIDLHWRLAPGSWGLPDFREAWERREQLTIGGAPVATLGRADAFAHTVSHAAKDDWRWLRSVVDVHRLARQLDPSARLRSVDLTTLAVADATIGLPPQVPADLVDRARAAGTRAVRTATATQDAPIADLAQVTHGSGLAQAAVGALRGNRSPRDVVRVVWGVLLPGRHLGDLTDRSALTGVPRALWRRVRTAFDKLVVARFRRGA